VSPAARARPNIDVVAVNDPDAPATPHSPIVGGPANPVVVDDMVRVVP